MKSHLRRNRCVVKVFETFASSVIILLFSFSCSLLNQDLKVSGFRFTFEDNNYFIRSIYCPNNPQSCNHLIGKDFEALDINQDRVIDKIVEGDVSIYESQRIYNYALDLLEKENKLSVLNKDKEKFQFTIEKSYLIFEITSFQPELGDPFNQFKVVQKAGMGYKISVYNDLKADGTLDEKLDGTISIVDSQKYYLETIDDGIRANKITKTDGFIRVQ